MENQKKEKTTEASLEKQQKKLKNRKKLKYGGLATATIFLLENTFLPVLFLLYETTFLLSIPVSSCSARIFANT